MKHGDFTTGVARLQDALEMLENAWQNTREHWTDATAQRFEEDHLRPIVPNLNSTLTAVSRLKSVMNDAARDCGDDERRTFL